LALLPFEDLEAAGLLSSIPEETQAVSWWLVLHDGMPIAGDEGGGVALLLELPGTREIGNLLKTLRLSPVVDALDRLVARQRGRLSRIVPDVKAPRRYP
jgi:hypothetical protein